MCVPKQSLASSSPTHSTQLNTTYAGSSSFSRTDVKKLSAWIVSRYTHTRGCPPAMPGSRESTMSACLVNISSSVMGVAFSHMALAFDQSYTTTPYLVRQGRYSRDLICLRKTRKAALAYNECPQTHAVSQHPSYNALKVSLFARSTTVYEHVYCCTSSSHSHTIHLEHPPSSTPKLTQRTAVPRQQSASRSSCMRTEWSSSSCSRSVSTTEGMAPRVMGSLPWKGCPTQQRRRWTKVITKTLRLLPNVSLSSSMQ